MDSLISLIIDLISSLMGRSKKEEDAPPPVSRPDPSRPRPQVRPTSWEDELRRLLEGQSPTAPAPPVQRPPPVMAPQTPQVPRPLPMPQPRVITVMAPERQPVRNPVPAYSPPRPVPVLIPSDIEVGAGKMAPMTESQQAYFRASQIDRVAAAQIERVPGQHVQNTKVIRHAVSPEVTQVIAMFKNAQVARQAVLISAVFGPPKAFEEQTSANF